jgi:hypothetical protein
MLIRRLLKIGAAVLLLSNSTAQANDYSSNQKYWDGKKSPALKWNYSCKPTPEQFAQDNPDYASPPLMALGDSLYNGVQSLHINWFLSEWSPPALVAIRLGLIEEKGADRTGNRSFYTPQYPKHGGKASEVISYGFNLETPRSITGIFGIFGLFSILGAQKKVLTDLLNVYTPPNRRAMVDNLAFSGANSLDLIYWTPQEYRKLAKHALKRMNGSVTGPFLALGDAFTYANASFVLNPMRDKCLEKMTPLEQVELRRPKRLLINIGSNNGLYKIGFMGLDIENNMDRGSCGSEANLIGLRGKPHCISSIKTFSTTQFMSDTDKLMERLATIKGLEYVYINNLAIPSQVANVVFPDRSSTSDSFKLNILGGKKIPRRIINNGDALVRQVNEDLKRRIAKRNTVLGPKFVYVDVNKAMEEKNYKQCVYAGKNNCDEKKLLISSDVSGTSTNYTLDNRPLKISGPSSLMTGSKFASHIEAGGLFSFDNMHLSSVGYEIMAFTVRHAMQQAKDPALFKLPSSANDNCDPKATSVRPGDCIGLLTLPGWSLADATRREFVFQRIAGDREMKNRRFISALLAFAQ